MAYFSLGGNYLKNCLITFSIFRHEANEGTNELSKDGFHLIALKVIFIGPKLAKGLLNSDASSFYTTSCLPLEACRAYKVDKI